MMNKVTGKGVGENVHSFFCKYSERIRREKSDAGIAGQKKGGEDFEQKRNL